MAYLRILALGCALIALAAPSFAIIPLPSSKISDDEAVQLLSDAYRERVTLTGVWKATPRKYATEYVRREICADSGEDNFSPRQIAVCTSEGFRGAGSIDLWMLLDARKPGEHAKVGAVRKGITHRNEVALGKRVELMEIGSSRTAFVVISSSFKRGWQATSVQWFHAEHNQFEEVIQVITSLRNMRKCEPGDGEACVKASAALECKLRVDRSGYEQGFYALALDVSGTRAGRAVNLTLPIPRTNGAYVLPSAGVLQRDGCNFDPFYWQR